jgi:hypothetical protein
MARRSFGAALYNNFRGDFDERPIASLYKVCPPRSLSLTSHHTARQSTASKFSQPNQTLIVHLLLGLIVHRPGTNNGLHPGTHTYNARQ